MVEISQNTTLRIIETQNSIDSLHATYLKFSRSILKHTYMIRNSWIRQRSAKLRDLNNAPAYNSGYPTNVCNHLSGSVLGEFVNNLWKKKGQSQIILVMIYLRVLLFSYWNPGAIHQLANWIHGEPAILLFDCASRNRFSIVQWQNFDSCRSVILKTRKFPMSCCIK